MIKYSVSDLKRLARNSTTIRALLVAGLFIALFLLFVLNTAPQKHLLQVGDISDKDIYAPTDIVDKSATELRRKQAEDSVQPVYNLDLTVQIDIEKKISDFFMLLNSVRSNAELDKVQKLNLLKQNSNISLGNSLYNMLLDVSEADFASLEHNIKYINNQMLSGRITEQQLNDKRSDIREFFMNLPKKSQLNEIGADIAVMVLKPNMYYDEQTTLARKQSEREKVEDVVIRKGTLIVGKGQELSSQQIQLLNAYGLLAESDKDRFDIQFYLGYGVIIGICLIIMGLYLRSLDKKLWDSNSTLLLISLTAIMALTVTMMLKNISQYLIVLPAGAMLVSILVSPRIAIMTNIMTSILAGFLGGFDLHVVVMMLLTGILGAGMVSKTHHRSTFILSGLAVSLVSLLVIFSEGILNREDIYRMINNGLYGVIGGTLSAVLTIGTLPFFETVFDIITPLKLLELSNPNQPMLRRLLIEAPGTYYHSILVGNLAEAAAEDIGANALLCRVGAYYHDIGKLKRPYFFKENQITRDNPHDKITPNLSALVITSHVKDGVEIAGKNKLPSTVIRIIEEHHGNTLVAYFYHKALSAEGAEAVDESKFRYPFRKPQTEEAAIVMLADSVEAYIRSLSEPTRDQVEQGVRKIIKDKLNDAQLDNCDLTLKDLEMIGQAFVKVLAGIFHDRIEYPETIKDVQ
ncbi:MAG TPA: HDIG domain-containing protein [Bacillota bacterium]|nr:HDIG domain-containing protein [Bacillota bacterium]HNT04242.1 HDIG domain-containing protein [Bacillota bacterium]HPA55058.1 HDIG domain-containing protein [Bacillota bacterium]HQA65975.1 HDIG domain-containing protein [Bacillota bacterium]HQO42868.1 HDIG domain-containing protein [Bacillota bacterium]